MKWKAVVGYEGIYEVSNTGLVKSLSREKHCGYKGSKPQITEEKILAIRTDRAGYKRVKLSKNGVARLALLHRVVAQAFVMNVNSYREINHKDGNKENNFPSNLEWVTRSGNMKHAFEKGLKHSRKGESNNKAKITENDVRRIREMRKNKHTLVEISMEFGITATNVSNIVNFKTWKEVE